MRSIRSTHRLATWLATLALLLGALAPAVAQALVDTRGESGWVEICSSSGMRWVQIDVDAQDGDPASNEPMADGSRHCPWCNLGSGAAGLPPEPITWGLLDVRSDRPTVVTGVPLSGADRFSAQPRAPPQV